MGRPALTIVVVLARGDDGALALAGLEGQLAGDDEVVVIGGPQLPGQLPARFAHHTLADPADVWDARAAAVRAAGHEMVLLLCGDTELAPGALDRLAGALRAHPELDACAPGGGGTDKGRRSRVRPAGRLAPGCLLVRRTAPDLVLEGRGRRGRLATVDGAAARHAGENDCLRQVDPEAPLLTLAMIVKDEEERVADAIRSAAGVVDDIVVYDTGSHDSTREVADAAGARVVAGYWDDDFAAARNRALENVRTPWVVFLDADEELEVDSGADFREMLRHCPQDALGVTCRNLGDRGGVNLEFRLARVMRRGRVRWDQPLHEQVVHHLTGRMVDVVLAQYDGLRLRHTGYRTDVMQAKGKLERNDAVARQELLAAEAAADPERLFSALVNAARSLPNTPGGRADALNWCERAWALRRTAAATPFMLARVTYTAACRALDAGDVELTCRWRDRFLEVTGNAAEAQLLDSRIAVLRADIPRAIELVESLPDVYVTLYGRAATRAEQLPWVLQLRVAQGLDATRTMEELVAGDVAEMELLQLLAATGGDISKFARILSSHPAPALMRSVCGQALAHPQGSTILRALHDAVPGDPVPLAAAASLPPEGLSLDDAVYWSLALREIGQSDRCPLLRLRDGSDSIRAALACAVLAEHCRDEESFEKLADRLASVPPEAEAYVVQQMRLTTPRLAEALVVA